MDFLTLAKERYSLRQFSDKMIEKEKMDKILEAAQWAPTACNYQPQRIFVLNSREAVEKADKCCACHFGSPAMIIVAYDPEAAWKRKFDGKNHGEIDAAIVTTNIMMEAVELGLGTTYIGMFDPKLLHEEFKELEGLVPVAVLAIGYPADDAAPGRLHPLRNPIEDTVKYL